jgi:hypothetical protein
VENRTKFIGEGRLCSFALALINPGRLIIGLRARSGCVSDGFCIRRQPGRFPPPTERDPAVRYRSPGPIELDLLQPGTY